MVEILKKDDGTRVGNPSRDEYSGSGEMTVLANDTEIKGDIKFGRAMKVEGKFEGKIESQGRLFVTKSAEIKAEIMAGEVEIEGKVNGNIRATNVVRLRGAAELVGDVTAARLMIEEGVTFIGKCEVRPSGIKHSDFTKSLEKDTSAASSNLRSQTYSSEDKKV